MAKATTNVKLIQAEESMFGSEPTFEKIWDDPDLQILSALNWYNTMSKNSDLKKYAINWYESTGAPVENINALKTLEDSKFFMVGKYARLMTLNAPMVEEQKTWAKETIEELVSRGKTIINKDKDKESPSNIKKIQERIKEVSSTFINQIDQEIDKLSENKDYTSKFDITQWLKDRKLKVVYAEAIVDHFSKTVEELAIAISGVDPDLKEGYSHLTSKQLANYHKFIENIVNKVGEWGKVIKNAPKAPRAKKVVPPEKQVAKLKLLEKDDEHGLVSVTLKKIVGAQEIWFWWPKQRVLGVYKAMDSGGFSVKGNKLINYDPMISICKKIRKPNEILPIINTKGKREINKTWTGIKAKEYKLNGKLKEEHLIFKIQ